MSYFPTWKLKTSGIIAPDERLPIGQTLALGVQHVVAMFGSTVLAPLLMGFDPNLCILMSGLGTLIFFLLVGGHVPSYLGSSFAFIGVVISATGYVAGSGMNPNIPTALGGIVICGLIYAIVGLIVMSTGVRWIERLMPPVVTGAVVAVIGLNLAPTAVKSVGPTDFDAWIAILTVLCVGGVAVYTRGLIQKLLILVGLSLAYVIYAILTNGMGLGTPINFAKISEAAWFGMPQFETPVFSLSAITLIAPVVIILVGENLGHIKAVTAMTGRNLDPYMGRAFLGDGLATMFSASCGGTGVTTYGENIGVMAATRVYSTLLFPVAACFAIILGCSHSDNSAANSWRYINRGLRAHCCCGCSRMGGEPCRFRRQPQSHRCSRNTHFGWRRLHYSLRELHARRYRHCYLWRDHPQRTDGIR